MHLLPEELEIGFPFDRRYDCFIFIRVVFSNSREKRHFACFRWSSLTWLDFDSLTWHKAIKYSVHQIFFCSVALLFSAVPKTYLSSSSLLELNKARAFFELEYSIIFLQTPNSDKNWQTCCPNVCYTITGQIYPCLQGRCTSVPGLSRPYCRVTTNEWAWWLLLFDAGYKYSYLLTLPSTRVLDKILDRVLKQ